MLFEIGFMIISVISPILVLIAYRQGIKDKVQVEKKEQLQPFFSPKPQKVKVDPKTKVILSNIDNYDGTDNNQREVK